MNEKIRITFILPSFSAGGAEKIVYLLCKYLDKSLFHVCSISLHKRGDFFEFQQIPNLQVEVWDFQKAFHAMPKLLRHIRKTKPHFVFSSITHLNTLVCSIKPFFPKNTKLYLRETNVLKSYHTGQGKRSKMGIVGRFQKLLYKRADHIICQSSYMFDEISRLHKIEQSKIHIVNNLVEKPSQEIIDHNFDCIAVGNLKEIKGYDRMLDAFNLVKDKSIRLGIIGEGNQRELLEKKIFKLNLSKRVKLLGRYNNPSAFMQNAKLILMTSHFEGFPNVLLEAGMCGLPAIAFDTPGGIKEYINNDENGFLVENGNLNLFAQKIQQGLIFKFDRMRIKTITENTYGIQKIIHQYKNLFSYDY